MGVNVAKFVAPCISPRSGDPMNRLENGDRFPEVEMPRLDTLDPVRLPADLDGRAAVLVFYRGHF